MTTARRPASGSRGNCSSKRSSAPNSSLTAMRSAWKVRVAGSMPWPRGRGTQRAPARPVRSVVASGSASPRLDNAASDPATETLLAVLVNQVGEVAFVEATQQGAGRLALAGVEPHVERARLAETEAALRVVHLIGANAEVGQHAIDRRDAQLIEDIAKAVVISRESR